MKSFKVGNKFKIGYLSGTITAITNSKIKFISDNGTTGSIDPNELENWTLSQKKEKKDE